MKLRVPHGTVLPTYSPDRCCPKCWWPTVNTTYVGDGCRDADCATCDIEHLCRTCQRCGYQWAEAPLRASEDKPASVPGHGEEATP